MNFEKDSVPVLAADLKDNSGNTLKLAMSQLDEDDKFGLHTLHPASRLNPSVTLSNRKACSSQILRQVWRPLESGCGKSNGQIEGLPGPQLPM